MKFLVLFILSAGVVSGWSCDLCAIYSAGSALGESGNGLSFTISEQFIPYRTLQIDGEEVDAAKGDS